MNSNILRTLALLFSNLAFLKRGIRGESVDDFRLKAAIGQRLQYYRRSAGFTQEELGFEVDLHRTYISLVERGKSIPSIKTLFELCKVLDVEPGTFITEVSDLMKKRPRKR